MQSDLKEVRARVNRLLAERKFYIRQVLSEKEALAKVQTKQRHAQKALDNLQAIAELIQKRVHAQISPVVTKCLKTVFGTDSFDFKIDFKRVGDRTEARLIFLRDGEEFNPREESGGGAVDVAAFALRLSCIMCSRPRLRRVLILDEPFKFVNGEEYQERLAGLLPIWAKDMNLQMIISTGNDPGDEWLRIGKIIDLDNLEKTHE